MTALDHRPVTGLPAIPTPRLPVLDEVRVVPGEVVRDVQECTGRRVYNRPYMPPWAITDPDEITAMRIRIKWHRAPFWWRAFHSRPPEPTHLTPYRPEVPRG